MKGLLVLCWGLVALAAASGLTLQERVVDLVLETFHNRKGVQWVYKEQAVEEFTEPKSPAGSFVQLRLRLQQTQCPNRPGSRKDCAPKRRGRKLVCLACVTFDSQDPGEVLAHHIQCRTETQQAVKETAAKDEEECRTVQETTKAPHFPGIFAFSRALPS